LLKLALVVALGLDAKQHARTVPEASVDGGGEFVDVWGEGSAELPVMLPGFAVA
jgi:hypothetical protein